MASNMDLSKIFNVQNLDNRDYIIIGLIVLLFSLLFFRKKREHFITGNNGECGTPSNDGKIRIIDNNKCATEKLPYCEFGPTFIDPTPSFHCSKYNCTNGDECKVPEKGGINTPRPYCVKTNGATSGFCGNQNDLERALFPSSFPAGGSMNR